MRTVVGGGVAAGSGWLAILFTQSFFWGLGFELVSNWAATCFDPDGRPGRRDCPLVDNDPVRGGTSLARRHLLRGGAVLAGVAGAAVVGAALAPSAEAADGDGLVLEESNGAESGTGLTIGAAEGSSSAALALTNADGPTLQLTPLDDAWDGSLQPGQIANTGRGPLTGISQGGNQLTTPLLTEQDVWLPFVLATPMRLINTRTTEGRLRVTRPLPLAAGGRLPARTALTFWIAPAGGQGGSRERRR